MSKSKLAILSFVLIASCVRPFIFSDMNNISIKITELNCIDESINKISLRIYNGRNAEIYLDADRFVFKAIYSEFGKLLKPKLLYDPVKVVSGDVIIIGPKETRLISINFNDLIYYDLSNDIYIIELEYLKTNRTSKTIADRIPIDPLKVHRCEQ